MWRKKNIVIDQMHALMASRPDYIVVEHVSNKWFCSLTQTKDAIPFVSFDGLQATTKSKDVCDMHSIFD